MIKVKFYAPLVAAVMLTFILFFQGWQLTTLLLESQRDYARGLLLNLAERAQTSLARRIEDNDDIGVRQLMTELRIFNHETSAFLVGADLRVVASDRLGYDGAPIDTLPIPIDREIIRSASTTWQGEIAGGHSELPLIAYFPINMSRPNERPFSKVGVLLISLNVKQSERDVLKIIGKSILSSSALVFLIVGSVAVALHFGLTRRISAIQTAVSEYLSGNTNARITDRGGDEISEIADAFNQFADAVVERQEKLERSQAELSNLAHTLEHRVSERTLALEREGEERARAVAALNESRRELQSVLDLAPDGIVVIDKNGMITKFNKAAENIFGRAVDDVVGSNVSLLTPEPHRSAHNSYLKEYQRTGVQKVIGREREMEAERANGEKIQMALSVSEFQLNGEPHYIGIVRDIRERKAAEAAMAKAQQRLIDAEKMAALGGLVAGIAHEVNTPVGVALTAISYLNDEFQQAARHFQSDRLKRSGLVHLLDVSTRSATIIQDNLTRAAQLIRSFKEVAVDQAGDDVRTIKVHEYLTRVITSLQPQVKNRPIRILVNVEPVSLAARLQAGGLSQIITNLVLNSLSHAFAQEDSGEIAITVTRAQTDMILSYRDSGCGMSESVSSRIFEPFFTTKRGQGGSGLGMNIVYNLVTQKYKGEIRCESEVGGGTVFTITIPNCVV